MLRKIQRPKLLSCPVWSLGIGILLTRDLAIGTKKNQTDIKGGFFFLSFFSIKMYYNSSDSETETSSEHHCASAEGISLPTILSYRTVVGGNFHQE